MDPNNAKSPRKRLALKQILYNTYVEGKTGGFAIANLEYDGKNVIGIRWNGFDENDEGFPNSRGWPTWFILPKEVALAYVIESKDRNKIELVQATDENPYYNNKE